MLPLSDPETDFLQEGWLAQNAEEEKDLGSAEVEGSTEISGPDPMQGLEGLDVAGPRPA